MISRQWIVGWGLVLFAGGSLLYYLKTRLLVAGPPLDRKEWVQGIGLIVLLIIGTINVRMAAMRRQQARQSQKNPS